MITQENSNTPSAKPAWTKPQLKQVGGYLEDIQAFSGTIDDGVYGATTS